jgi:two-component system, response regulator PdtaR
MTRPLAPAKGHDDSIAGTADGAGENPGVERPPRILIVEDEFLIALELEHRLLEAGFAVVGIAVTAGEAIRLAASERPDIAIMDIRLAGQGDGVDAAIELFAAFGIRSVFASAHADMEIRKRASPASPVAWLQKPYPAEALIRLIKAHFRQP